jgi:hypothetical protein
VEDIPDPNHYKWNEVQLASGQLARAITMSWEENSDSVGLLGLLTNGDGNWN